MRAVRNDLQSLIWLMSFQNRGRSKRWMTQDMPDTAKVTRDPMGLKRASYQRAGAAQRPSDVSN